MGGTKLTEEKPLEITFELNPFLLTMLYVCQTYNLSMDLILSLYEKYEKDCLFIFKIMICKKNINLSDKQLLKVLNDCKILYRQILRRSIVVYDYDLNFQNFIKWLTINVKDLFEEEVTLKLSYQDLYDGVK